MITRSPSSTGDKKNEKGGRGKGAPGRKDGIGWPVSGSPTVYANLAVRWKIAGGKGVEKPPPPNTVQSSNEKKTPDVVITLKRKKGKNVPLIVRLFSGRRRGGSNRRKGEGKR